MDKHERQDMIGAWVFVVVLGIVLTWASVLMHANP